MLIRPSDWPLRAIIAIVLFLGAAIAPPSFAGVAGTDCNCTATGAYLVPDPGVKPRVGTINAAQNVITSPSGKYRLERLGSNVQDPWRVVRASNGAVLHPGIVANNFTWSPDDDRLATNRQDASALQYFSLWDLTDLSVNGRAAEIWTLGGTVWASVRHRFSDDGSSYLFAGDRNRSEITLKVVDIPTRALHETTFPVGTLPSDIDTDLPENLGAPSNPGIAGWGWGPDATRFTYAWRTGTSTSEISQRLVNVRRNSVRSFLRSNPSAKWGFSPCGDVFGVVSKQFFNQDPAIAQLYKSFDPATINPSQPYLGQQAFEFDTVELRTTASEHVGLLRGLPTRIAANAAGDACSTTNENPTAVFTPPATPYSGAAARFTDTSSDDDGTVAAWSWDFGDGGAATDRNPEHVYAAPGTYTVRLTVTDDDGATGSTTRSVVVVVPPPIPPVASFAPPANPRTGQPAAFVNLSTDSDGTIVSHAWDFGDGESSTEVSPVHVYDQPGEYTALLTVTDDDGQTDTATRTVIVCGTVGVATGKLLFGDQYEFGADPDLRVLNTPAQSFVKITASSPGTPSGGSGARWSPDGTEIAYAYNNFTFSQQSIFVMNADGTNRRQLTGVGTQVVTASAPRWTPDGQWIAFDNGTAASTPGGVEAPGIYAVRRNGTGLVRVADGTLEDVSPLLGPGCGAIAPAQRTLVCYTFLRSFRYTEISTVRGDGNGSRVLFDTPGVISPRYSPNGAKIAFVFFLGDRHPTTLRDLYSIFVAKVPSDPGPIVFDPKRPLLRGATYFFPGSGTFDGQVVWSPDGRELAFTDADLDLSLSDAGGCEVQRVPGQPGGDVMPFDWKRGAATQARSSVTGSVLVQNLGTGAFSPAAGTVVRINGGGVNTTTTTDANGRYSFASLPIGESFFVSLDALAGADISFGGRVVPELVGSAANANLFGVTGTVLLSGQVATPAGFGGVQPVAGVTVRVEGPTGPYQATTGADGRYSIAVRPLRNYTITPALAGYRFAPTSRDVAVGIAQSAANDFEAREVPPGFVAFTSSRDRNDEIYVSELDGAFEKNLTNNPAHDVEPAVSPDGSKIAFASDRSGSFRIYTMNVDGSDVTGLETFPSSGVPLEGREPAWSLDGAHLAIATSAGLRIVSFDGSEPTVATSDPTDTSPSWDRSGTRIYFERVVDDVGFGLQPVVLWAVDLSGPNAPVETVLEYSFGAFRGDPAAKPDGPGLAHTYDGDLDPRGGYIVTRNDATSTTSEFGGRDPAWAPDGQHIVGVASGDKSFLFWSEPDGVRQRIFTTSGADREPSWGPGSLEPKCGNGIDDDRDGLTDLDDPGCTGESDRSERGVDVCDDERDDDGDGFAAFPQDPGCTDISDADEIDARWICDNGLDDDGDGFIDVQDPGCPFPQASLENPPCDNGVDDDGDGLIDADDPTCQANWPYWESPPACGLGFELVVLLPLLRRGLARRRG